MEIEVTFNGEKRVVASATTVENFLAELGLANKKIAVELNREIVTRSSYATTELHSGDSIEIVHFVGGG